MSANYRKPIQGRRNVKKSAPESVEPDFTHAEIDLAARAAASLASQDLSVQEDGNMSDAEVLKRFRTSMQNTVLPSAPNLPGLHACWVPLSSNNRFDTVDARKQLGYVVVKEEEVPNFISPSNRAGQIEGCVSHNELILMKIPLRLYNLYMKESHHNQPNEQERIIRDGIDANLVDKDGQSIKRDDAEMTGMRKLARKVAEPNFS